MDKNTTDLQEACDTVVNLVTLILVAIFFLVLLPLLVGCSEPTEYTRCMALCEQTESVDDFACRSRVRTNIDCHTHCGYNLDRALLTGCDDLAEDLLSCQELAGMESQCVDCALEHQVLGECLRSFEN